MQEIFFTILVIWVLFKIFGRTHVRTYTFNQTNYNRTDTNPKKEGDVSVKSTSRVAQKSKDTDGEYVDFEEIK